MTGVEQITDPVANHGEGPVWWPGWGGLRWVDLLAGDVLTLADDETVRRRHVGPIAAAIRPWVDGIGRDGKCRDGMGRDGMGRDGMGRDGMVVAGERGFALVDDDRVMSLGDVWTDPTVRMNDGACDPDGRFYCGSMAYDGTAGRGSLYRIDRDFAVTVVLDHVTVSNGLAWSPDGSAAYYIDTGMRRVDIFDYDGTDGLRNRRPLCTISDSDGVPDGMTIDAEGHLWVAMHGGRAVHRFRPDGTPDGRVEMPVRDVTACTFGGPGLDRLYITTSRADDPDSLVAGALFRADVGVRGLSTLPFRAAKPPYNRGAG
jgi:sugar lactone lactonase YvrE